MKAQATDRLDKVKANGRFPLDVPLDISQLVQGKINFFHPEFSEEKLNEEDEGG
jgi:hypothetical protein